MPAELKDFAVLRDCWHGRGFFGGAMNNQNACIFLGLGLVMQFLPAVFPQWFLRMGIDGANTSALWLGFMGCVQSALGGSYLVWRQARSLVVWWLTPRKVASGVVLAGVFGPDEPEVLSLPAPSEMPAA